MDTAAFFAQLDAVVASVREADAASVAGDLIDNFAGHIENAKARLVHVAERISNGG